MMTAATQHAQRVAGLLRTELEKERIALARAQDVFAEEMAFAEGITRQAYASRRFGQGMCRPGWTGDMWKHPHRP